MTGHSPAAHPMAWADAAACAGMDPDQFFVDSGQAIAVEVVDACRRCEVRPECLDWALRHERLGYWAGTSEKQRRTMRKTLRIRLEAAPDPFTDTGDDEP